MYGYESWTINKSWVVKNWCFWIVVLEKTHERESLGQRGDPKEISCECSLEGLMLKLRLQYFGHLMRRTDSSEKTLMLGKIEGGRRRGWQRMRCRGWDVCMASPTQWTWVWVNSGSWRWTGRPGVLQSMGLQRVRHDWAIELNWIETGDSKSEHWHFRNQCTKMEQNEWIQFRWPLYLLWTRIPFKKWKSLHSQEKSLKCNTWMQSQKWQKDLCLIPKQTIQGHSNPSICPNH